jgi:zinc protease
VKGLPAQFETSGDTTTALTEVFAYNLGLNYFTGFAARVSAVTPAMLKDLAVKYLEPDKMMVVAVGDQMKIAGDVRKALPGPVEYRDTEGKKLPGK